MDYRQPLNWPLCECGCGEPVSADKRSGRPNRYAKHGCSIRASKKRIRKRNSETKTRRCRTCGRVKSPTAFDGPFGKRCHTCQHAAKTARCIICGDLAGTTPKGDGRTYCGKPECLARGSAQFRHRALVEQGKKLAARKTKTCPNCNVRKPLTREFWSPGGGKTFHGGIRWDSYCKLCRAAINRDRHHSSEKERERKRAADKAYRLEIRKRRDADPVFDAEYRAKRQRQKRQTVERKAVAAEEEVRFPGGVELPALPLAEFIDREARRQHLKLNGHAPKEVGTTLEHVCTKLGVAPRRVREWREMPDARVRFDVADRVITNAGLLWFDVYDEQKYPMAAMAFTGEVVAA